MFWFDEAHAALARDKNIHRATLHRPQHGHGHSTSALFEEPTSRGIKTLASALHVPNAFIDEGPGQSQRCVPQPPGMFQTSQLPRKIRFFNSEVSNRSKQLRDFGADTLVKTAAVSAERLFLDL